MKTLEKPKGRIVGSKNKTLADRLPKMADGSPIPPGRPQHQRVRPEHQDEVRAKIQASNLVRRLQDHANGTIEMTPTQIKAAEILLSKSLSSLQAVEINNVSQNDKLSEAEIIGKIAALMAANPALRSVVTLEGVARDISGGGVISNISDIHDISEHCAICGGEGMQGGCPGCGGDPDEGGGA